MNRFIIFIIDGLIAVLILLLVLSLVFLPFILIIKFFGESWGIAIWFIVFIFVLGGISGMEVTE